MMKSVNWRRLAPIALAILVWTPAAAFAYTCPNAICEVPQGENIWNCWQDCWGMCQDNICNPAVEDPILCPQDCSESPVCMDGRCNLATESPQTCAQDCVGYCGDGFCNPYFETEVGCTLDCGTPAQITLELVGPGVPIYPGDEFVIELKLHLGTYDLFHYAVGINYPLQYMTLLYAGPGNDTEFMMPILQMDPSEDYARIMGQSNTALDCQTSADASVAKLYFQLTDYAPPGASLAIQFSPDAQLFDCAFMPLESHLAPFPWQNAMVNLIPLAYMQGAAGMENFLDLNGDGLRNEQDAIAFAQIMTGTVAEGDSSMLSQSTRNCDVNGNAITDAYDRGRMEALMRPIRLIHSGADGVCQTTAGGDDVQEIIVGRSEPNTLVIDVGPNLVLDTNTPGGDDVRETSRILSGPNGIAQTTQIGDDVQAMAINTGLPGAICVNPGADYALNSTATDDDLAVSDAKDLGALLALKPQPGQPAKLIPISPVPNTTVPYYIDFDRPVPITVKVVDRNGRPKAGMSPVFAVIQGTGFFEGTGGSNVVGMIPTDFLGAKEGPAKGITSIMFRASIGLNQVRVTLPGDLTIGLADAESLTYTIYRGPAGSAVEPNLIALSAASSQLYVGDSVTLNVTMNQDATEIRGHAQDILLLSSRNLAAGFDPALTGSDYYEAIFQDGFEHAGGLPGWTVDQGDGAVSASVLQSGYFGTHSVKFTKPQPAGDDPMILQTIQTLGHQDLRVAFQWLFTGTTPIIPPTLNVEYLAPGDTIPKPLRQIQLGAPDPVWKNENLNLRVDAAVNDSALTLIFSYSGLGPDNACFVDNVTVSGQRVVFEEDFEAYANGAFPSSFYPPEYIHAGEDGVMDTAKIGDDVAVIPLGQGKPNAPYIFGGPDNLIGTTAVGDDQLVAGPAINTGPNGIAQTEATGDDYQEIPLGQGQPYAVGIYPGPNLILDSIAVPDDERMKSLGPMPRIAVDNTVYPNSTPNGQGQGGSNKFLYLGRSGPGPMSSYAAGVTVNLDSVQQAKLTWYSKGPGQRDYYTAAGGGSPAQEYVVEVSDNYGQSWIKVFDFAGRLETNWTKHKLELHGDSRFNLTRNFLIRWRMTANNIEDSALDSDGLYLDGIQLVGAGALPDAFTPVVDTPGGPATYQTRMSTMAPGDSVKVIAVYRYPGHDPIVSSPVTIDVKFKKAVPESIEVRPDDFTLLACKSMDVMVVGRFTDTPVGKLVDMTKYFNLEVKGPARQTALGKVTADCFGGDTVIPIHINAVPRVPGLYDPGGGGGGGQTGDVSGKIYIPVTYAAAASAPVWIDLQNGSLYYTNADANGMYLIEDVPVGSNYKLYASKQNYTKNNKTVAITDGGNTSASVILKSGANFDDDGTSDSSDTDDDGDGVTDTGEANNDAKYDPDYDNDGYADDDDAFPTNAAEWLDTDADATGDNADTDDDNDAILDAEETVPGADGYITDPLLADTDSDSMDDKYEVDNGLNPTAAADATTDLDGDGLNNSLEHTLGSYANDWDSDNDNLPDGYEYDHRASSPALNLINAADAASDYDSDDNSNLQEYWNDSDPWTADPTPDVFANPGCYYWADGDGDGTLGPGDLSVLKTYVATGGAAYANVIPPNVFDTQDLDKDGVPGPGDISGVQDMLAGANRPSGYPASPTSLSVFSQPGAAIDVGDTTHVTIQVNNSATTVTKSGAFGVVFWIDAASTGSAVILGGDGTGSSEATGNRYDVSALSSAGGKATIVLKATGAGSIILKVRVPGCGTPTTGRYLNTLSLSPNVTITVQ